MDASPHPPPGPAVTPAERSPWWRSAVVYQIYPRSFADGNGDGVGDLEGIRRHLDHLAWLGVDAVWLSPYYRSPMADFGYDVSDYCDVDPLFGTTADFDRLVADAHDRGLRVLVDWVPNHTSDQHPWFVDSRSSRHAAKRDWYIWRDRPNNWEAAIGGGSAWTFDQATGQYYLHFFLPQQPDLNWDNPEVVEAMHGVLRFWLDRGVDGFRIDVAHGIGKDPALPDDPPSRAGLPHTDINDEPRTHELLRDIRRVVDSYPGDRVLVGEVNLRSTATVARYYGSADELHLAFNFPPVDAPWAAGAFRAVIDDVETHLRDTAWPTWFLSNHDVPRHRSRFGGSVSRAAAAAVLLLTLRGTVFLYQGDELGLLDAAVPPALVVDPGGRDGCRAPIPWDASPAHGWDGTTPWLPFPPEADVRNVAMERGDPRSMLSLYRSLVAVRHSSAALSVGAFDWLPAPSPDVLVFRRSAGGDERVVCVNFGAVGVDGIALAGDWEVELASDHGGGGRFTGAVGPDQALILRPAGH